MTARTLQGFMELLPEEQIVMEKMKAVIAHTYELFGFAPLDTPVLELAEVLLSKSGGDTEKQIYEFKKGDTDLAMRFDLTVPLAKYVALYNNSLTFPFKRYQIGKVYRGERPQKGRFREFYQCDIDIIDRDELNIVYDAEVLELFAGSGALSLECISRGAHSSTCIEKARRHADILRSNWEYCGFEKSRLTLRVQDAYVAIEQLSSLGGRFDLILADPPFGEKNIGVRSNSFAQRLLDSITLRMLLKEDGLFLLGSVFLKINTAIHTIINDVNVPKLHSSAAVDMFKNNVPSMQIRAVKTVIMCGVLYFL